MALVASLVRALTRRDGAAPAEPAAPARSVLDEIEALAAASERAYDAAAMHERLAALAAFHLESALGLRRRERTTAEIVRVARARLGPNRAAEVERVLAACDLVKFARATPDAAAFRALAAELAALVRSDGERV
jgi:hypothetical protein